jgi:hypothetical protein
MSVNIFNPGSNSRQIVVKDEYHPAATGGIIEKINTAITALGWTLFDTVSSGVRDCFITKVYTAPCVDSPSPSTKYMILRFDAPRQYFYMSCAESWNDTTHVATNECFTQYRGFPLPLQTSNLIIYIFATQRYCVIQPVLRGEPGIWQGIFEFRRVFPDTSAGAPCFGYTNAVILGSPFYSSTPNTTGQPATAIDIGTSPRNHVLPFWVPRLNTGETGLAAAKNSALSIGSDDFPPNNTVIPFNSNAHIALSNSTFSTYGTGITNVLGHNINYRSNTELKTFLNPRLTTQTKNFGIYGRIFGMNITTGMGENLDTIQIPIDGDGFFSNSGTSSKHFILGLTGGNDMSFVPGQNRLKLDIIDHDVQANGALFYDGVVVRGRYVYLTCGNTTGGFPVLKRYNLDTNKWSETSLPGAGESLVYDGGNNIYVSTDNGITRINVDNTAIIANLTLASLAGGAAALAVCDNYVYAMQQTASPTNNVLAVVNSSFQVERYVTGIPTNNTTISSRYSIIFSPDYADNKVVIINSTTPGTTAPPPNTANFIISGSNGAFLSNSYFSYSGGYGSQAANSCTSVSYFYDNNYIVLKYNPSYSAAPTTIVSGFTAILRTSNLQLIASNTLQSATTTNYRDSGDATASVVGARPFKMREAIPFKGYRFSHAHRGGVTGQSSDVHFRTFYDHQNESSVSVHASTNAFACSFPHVAGCCFSDGVFYYRFNSNSSNNITRVSGQMQTKNNLGNTTPVLMIRA